ncbi:Protein RfbU [Acetobacter pasteurianus subsp. pasteurianus]|uniref:Protein RfbU n=2 Tax=Acetobacter pasteurianus TaxID=438 RepID=A0A1Y0XYJ1_ACEPA|nr:Protein RfbU [Acetobacter pasteurianus subsp. pasteurianus]
MQPVVAIGARNVGAEGGTGVSTYAATLREALQHNGAQVGIAGGMDWQRAPHALRNKFLQFVLALKAHQKFTFSQSEYSWNVSDFFRKIQVHFSTFNRITAVSSEYTPNIIHWSYPFPAYWENIPNIYTVHDLIPLLHPDLTGIQSERMQRILKQCMQRATAIVTVSEAVRQDIAVCFPEYIHKVVVLGQAVSLPFGNAKISAFHEGKEHFLYFGSIEKRKNIYRLIQAHGRSGTHCPLLLIGNDGFGAREELAAIAMHPKPDLVRHIPWCSKEHLLTLIQNARAVLFPSLAEGFGLPIVESMALGTPVMTSNGHATQEVAGNAALLVDPYNVSEMADAISLLDQSACLRQELTSAGLMRAQDFSMEHYMSRIASLYKRL